ncbi:c-type cytochrome [Roseibium sp.]|uniref:c-type cytochrome n=1 Tax=Roseibium sp. TaxID=1936156 RepID=UPI003A986600
MARRYLAAGIAGALLLGGLTWRFIEAQWRLDDNQGGAAIAEVVVPPLTEAALVGKALFDANCATCHGKNAAGQEGVAPPLVHRIYEPGHHGDGAFVIAALKGVRAHHWPFGDMPPVPGVTRDEVVRIVAYVRELQKANGIY